MRKFLILSSLFAFALTLGVDAAAATSTTRVYNKQGSYQGKAVRSGNTTRYYDRQGRSRGKAVTSGNTTRVYDRSGRQVSKTTTRRR